MPTYLQMIVVFFSADSTAENLETKLNDEFIKIKDYFDSNFLSINIQKTNFLHFKPSNKSEQKIRLKIWSKEIEEKEYLSYLGLIIDNKSNFKEYFEKIYSKIKKWTKWANNDQKSV